MASSVQGGIYDTVYAPRQPNYMQTVPVAPTVTGKETIEMIVVDKINKNARAAVGLGIAAVALISIILISNLVLKSKFKKTSGNTGSNTPGNTNYKGGKGGAAA